MDASELSFFSRQTFQNPAGFEFSLDNHPAISTRGQISLFCVVKYLLVFVFIELEIEVSFFHFEPFVNKN